MMRLSSPTNTFVSVQGYFESMSSDNEYMKPEQKVFRNAKGLLDSHTLKLSTDLIQMDCYLSGSITGGTGTECHHMISGKKIPEFLAAMEADSIDSRCDLVPTYKGKDWGKLHMQVHAHQTDVFVWSETNWDDQIAGVT